MPALAEIDTLDSFCGSGPQRPAASLPNQRHAFLFRKNPGERDEGAQNHDRLKADRANDPLQNVGPYVGDIGFEIGLKGRQICLRGKIIMRRFPQGFGKRLGLLRREMAFIPQRAGQAKGVEEKGAHPRNVALDKLKVHRRRGLNLRHEIGYHVQPKKIPDATRSKRNAG
jgi:hypothetical protein